MLMQHLEGKITLGQYQATKDEQCHWLCVEVEDHGEEGKRDLERVGRDLAACVDRLRLLAIKPLVEESSPGNFHVWILLRHALDLKSAHDFGQRFRVVAFGADSKHEVFPKQLKITNFGNLVRLPLGLHRQKKVWSRFVDHDPNEPPPLNHPDKIKLAFRLLEAEYRERLTATRVAKPAVNVTDRTSKKSSNVSNFTERYAAAKASLSIQDLVQIVLAEQGMEVPAVIRPGQIIKCPFHSKGDNGSSGSPSFMVGGHTAQNICQCWSTNCRLPGKKLNHWMFLQEVFGIEDKGQALELFEEYAGTKGV